jgi:hypothetical protein
MTEEVQTEAVQTMEYLLSGKLAWIGPGRWERYIRVEYVTAEGWRKAQADEKCTFGAGGRSGRKACGEPAYVTHDSQRGSKPYRKGVCASHAHGMVLLEDGTVAAPLTDPFDDES